ncbi:MAG: penicillin acylase family protein [Candidatus Hydrogenedentes bacterium]|nr:penicillin acylase family protein [Candidatus Hydrogenedentota bacterium]
MRSTTLRRCLVLAILLSSVAGAWAADLPGTGPDAGKTVVYRDSWGVAHIYAPTPEAGLFAMGWAQAQDRPTELLKNMLRGLGELATVEGKDAFNSDLVANMWDIYEGCKRGADKVRPEVRSQTQAFAAGVNAYYAKHPEDVPQWWGKRQVDEFTVMAFGRIFLQGWSFDDGFDDMKRAGIEPGTERPPRASNQWAVGPGRSAEKVPILLVDPHLGWLGASRFWEFRIHAGALRGSGFSLPGQMYIALGHNENIAWAMTTGGPDTADVYEETLNDDDPPKYKYNNEWRELTSRKVTINIKDGEPKTLTLWNSHHGPIAAFKNGKAYAIKSSYADAVGGNEAWYELNYAKDYHGAEAAMATLQVFPQNVMVADTSGNIYYQRTGRVPNRPDGYDWSKPLDGSTSASEWLGMHPSTDHVQILNPPQGYMQNCNIPPDVMMVDSPMTLAKTKPYLWSDIAASAQRDGWTTQRGARAVELLKADAAVTIEKAKAYALDLHPYGVEHWLDILKNANAKFGASHQSNPDYAAGMKDILGWDGELRKESTAALKYYYWRKRLVTDHGEDTMKDVRKRVDGLMAAVGKPVPSPELDDDELSAGLDSFVSAMAKLKADFGSLDKTYGDVFRVGRDDKSWPLDGNNGDELGMTTLRNIHYSGERPDHTRWGAGGQTSTQIIVMSKPVKSWTFVPLGQSDRPASPHYRDQAEKLLSPREFKETWWTPEQLAGHIESREVLADAK